MAIPYPRRVWRRAGIGNKLLSGDATCQRRETSCYIGPQTATCKQRLMGCNGQNFNCKEAHVMKLRILFVGACIVAAGAVAPVAFARVAVQIDIGVPPPPARVEVVPAPRPGYAWAPGYWAWNGHTHVWVGGHWMLARPGYHWVPEHWEHHEGRWRYREGYWAPEHYGRYEERHERHHDRDRHD